MNDITALMAIIKAAAADKVRYSVLTHNDCRVLADALEAKLPHHNGMMQLSNELVMAKQRIASLESRTVTVKLPKLYNMLYRDEFNKPYVTKWVYSAPELINTLRAAGIQVIEGEGQ